MSIDLLLTTSALLASSGRFDRVVVRGLSRFVSREAEMSTLREAQEATLDAYQVGGPAFAGHSGCRAEYPASGRAAQDRCVS